MDCRRNERALCDGFLDNVSMNIGETELASLKAIGQTFVIEAELVEQGGVQVVDVRSAFGDAEAEFIGCAVDMSRFESAAGDPHGERIDVMIAADGFADLAQRRAAELAAPDD